MTEHLTIDRSSPDEKVLSHAAEILKKGGLIAFPTDTVYALGVNVLLRDAVAKVYEVKQKPKSKPLPILLASGDELERFVSRMSPTAQKLVQAFWPGPLTLVLACDKGPLTGQKVGFRVPDDPIAIHLIKQCNVPIACPSANITGQPSPMTAQEVLKDFNSKVDLVIDAGPTEIGKESTVVEVNQDGVKFLRRGFIPQELIDTCINRPTLARNTVKKVLFVCTGNSCRSVMAEGLFSKLVQDKGGKDIQAISAGTTAFPGIRASENTILVMREEGVDISKHLSQPLTQELIANTDLIIAMTRAHQSFIHEISKSPQAESKKVHLLMEFASRWDFFGVDVEDPIGQPLWAYRNCLAMMKDPIQKLVELL